MKEVTCPSCGEYFYWQPDSPECPGCGKKIRVAAKKSRTLTDVTQRIGNRSMLDWGLAGLILLSTIATAGLSVGRETAHPDLKTFGTLPSDLIAYPEIEILLRPTHEENQARLVELFQNPDTPEAWNELNDMLFLKQLAPLESQLDQYLTLALSRSSRPDVIRALQLPRSRVQRAGQSYHRSPRCKLLQDAVFSNDADLTNAAIGHAQEFDLDEFWPPLLKRLEIASYEGRDETSLKESLKSVAISKWLGQMNPEYKSSVELASAVEDEEVLWFVLDRRLRAENRSDAYLKGLEEIAAKQWAFYVRKISADRLQPEVLSIIVKGVPDHRLLVGWLSVLPPVPELADIWIPLLQKSAELSRPQEETNTKLRFTMSNVLRRWQGLPEIERPAAAQRDFTQIYQWIAAVDRRFVEEGLDLLITNNTTLSQEALEQRQKLEEYFQKLPEDLLRAAIPPGETIDEATISELSGSRLQQSELIRKNLIAQGHDSTAMYLRTLAWGAQPVNAPEWDHRELNPALQLLGPSANSTDLYQSIETIRQQSKFGCFDSRLIPCTAIYARMFCRDQEYNSTDSQFAERTKSVLSVLLQIEPDTVRPLLKGQLLSRDHAKQNLAASLLKDSIHPEDRRLLLDALRSPISRTAALNFLSGSGPQLLPDVYELAARNDLDDEAQLSVCVLLSFFGDAESPMKLLKWRQDENQDVRSAVEMLLTAVDPRQVSPDTIRGYMKSAVERAESSVEQLITQLSDVDPLRQLEAIVQLSESIWDPTKNSEIDAAVRPLIESPDAAVQYFATYVQSRMCETTTAVTLLQQAADLPNYSQMLATYRGISDREDAELIPSYVTMLGSPGLQVMARVSLIRIALEHPEEVSTTVMPLTQGEDLEQVLEASIVLAATGLVPNEESLKDVAKRHPCFALFADGNLRSLLQRKKQSRQWQLEEKNSKKRP